MRVFIDTAPLIYFVEEHSQFAERSGFFIAESLGSGDEIVTSVITLLEFGVKPAKDNRPEANRKFEELLEKLNIEVHDIDKVIAKKAYELRAKYSTKPMDSIQLACAITLNCNIFFTNDKRLKKIEELEVKILEEI